MQADTQFDIKRFWHLVRNDLFTNFRSLLIAGGAAIGILLFINFFSMLGDQQVLVLPVFYCLMLFIGGYIITSNVFSDLHHPQKNYVYLTLPASNLEKFISKLLLTTVGYILGAMILYFLFSVIMSLVNLLFFGFTNPLFNPFDEVVWICNGVYLVTQSIFLLGAAFFRKNALIKTVFALWVGATALGIFAALTGRILFWEFIDGWHSDMFFHYFGLEEQLSDFFTSFGETMIFCFRWILAPVLWFITFLRLKEAEA